MTELRSEDTLHCHSSGYRKLLGSMEEKAFPGQAKLGEFGTKKMESRRCLHHQCHNLLPTWGVLTTPISQVFSEQQRKKPEISWLVAISTPELHFIPSLHCIVLPPGGHSGQAQPEPGLGKAGRVHEDPTGWPRTAGNN